ncbi:MAG: DUF4252 domain-containing protein [Verrucomicrobia bacterium]|jgi:hypothetical protein|nr:DUF4252 domain-containing protein [Verrucomicrobiota bacterium]
MKITTLLSLLLTAAVSLATAQAGTTDLGPGYVDLGKFTAPDDGGQFVEVQLTSNLIAIAARLTEKTEPELAKLLRGIQSVRVNVIGLSKNNRKELTDKVTQIRNQLSDSGWERVVTVRQKQDDVGVYLKLRGDESVEGIVVTVLEARGQAVLVNVVGDIRPEQIALLGERLHIDPLKEIGQSIH